MYLRAILCTFQISVDFYYVLVDGRGGAGEGGARERGIECILYGYSLAMSNQRSFKIGSFRFAAFVPKKIECKRF